METTKKASLKKNIFIRITADLSIETLQARREWQDILKIMKENNLQSRLLKQLLNIGLIKRSN